MIRRKFNIESAVASHIQKSSFGGSSPHHNSTCRTSSLSTMTPASTDMMDDLEDKKGRFNL